MDHAHAQVAQPAELPARKHDNDNQPRQNDRSTKGGHRWTKSFNRSATLLPQIGKLIGVRYGGPCNDDDAIVYYEAALPYLIDLAGANGRTLAPDFGDPTGLDLCPQGERLYRGLASFTPRTVEWARWCTPPLVPINDHALRTVEPNALASLHRLEAVVLCKWCRHQNSRFAHEPFGPDGRALGQALRITAAEMRAGDLRFVSPIDRTAAELASERRVSDAAYQRSRRDAAGAMPRSSSAEKLELWSAIGVSRRKFYKLKASGELPALPEIPRGADPTPYVAAFGAVYRSTRPTASSLARAA